jgi:hypothetical protein
VKLKIPAAVGVPTITPLLKKVVRANPAGSEPAVTLHVYGPSPPVANKLGRLETRQGLPEAEDVQMFLPASTFGKEVVVTASEPVATDMLTLAGLEMRGGMPESAT